MRIAQISPLTEAVPPKLYGGTERVISWLTEELVALGHDVTLFASGDSHTAAQLEPMWPTALRLDGSVRDANALHMTMLEQVRARPRSSTSCISISTTIRSRCSRASRRRSSRRCTAGSICRSISRCSRRFRRLPVISISNSQRRPVPQAGLGPHGPPRPARASAHAAADEADAILRFSAASRRRKRVDRAIRIAAALRAAAQDRGQGRQGRPRLFRERDPAAAEPAGRRVSSARSTMREKSEFLSGAVALLVPIDWPEPFGLVMIEAMACGTPVIAFNRGIRSGDHRRRRDRLRRRGRDQRGRRRRPAVGVVARNAVRDALRANGLRPRRMAATNYLGACYRRSLAREPRACGLGRRVVGGSVPSRAGSPASASQTSAIPSEGDRRQAQEAVGCRSDRTGSRPAWC